MLWLNGHLLFVSAGTHPRARPFHGLLRRSDVIWRLRHGARLLCDDRVLALLLLMWLSIPLAISGVSPLSRTAFACCTLFALTRRAVVVWPSISSTPLSGNLHGEFSAAFKRKRDGEESVREIADEFKKIRFGVVVHDVAAHTQVGSDDLDDLTRK